MFRVVETDNYGSDYPDEKFALPYYMNETTAAEIASVLNIRIGGSRYWKVVQDDYKLQPGFEP